MSDHNPLTFKKLFSVTKSDADPVVPVSAVFLLGYSSYSRIVKRGSGCAVARSKYTIMYWISGVLPPFPPGVLGAAFAYVM